MNRVLSFSKHCNRAIHHRCETQLQTAGPVASLIKSRSVIRFRGPDTVKFLQGLLTNDIRKFGEPIGDKTANLPTPMQIQGGPSGQTNHLRLPEIRVSKASVFRGKSKPSTSNCCTNKSKPCKSNTWNP